MQELSEIKVGKIQEGETLIANRQSSVFVTQGWSKDMKMEGRYGWWEGAVS